MSSPPKLVLDTTALRDKDFLFWLSSEYHGKVVVSPVAYMENKRQLFANRNLDPELIDIILAKANITIDTFGKYEAIEAAKIMSEEKKVCPECKKINWADTMIYSSIGKPPTILVSDNIYDFPDNGRVMTAKTVMEKFGKGRRMC